LAEHLQEDLLRLVVTGELAPGALLPTEQSLREQYGVSRTVVREAVKSLEALGLLHALQGHGTRVQPIGEWDLVNPHVLSAVLRYESGDDILTEVIHIRSSLEADMAAQAATSASDEQRALVSQRLRELEAAPNDAMAYLRADIAFHDSILASSGNRLGRAVIRNILVEAARSIRYTGTPIEGHQDAADAEHRAIHDAVVAGDEVEAARQMRRHILAAWERRRYRATPDPH